MKNIVIGQAGGPTAVINASLVGFLEAVVGYGNIHTVFNGYQGLVDDDIELLCKESLKLTKDYLHVPGACLGSGRYPFTDDKIAIAVKNLKHRNIDTLVFTGGNGTMAALERISAEAKLIGYDLQVIGIPKTVDNDLGKTDHAPGFGSAAKYVALATRDISKDLEAMKNFEQVRIIETMGRNAGWLAASSGFLKAHEQEGPHLIYVPEKKLTKESFIRDVDEVVKKFGFAMIVISEGVSLTGHSQIEKAVVQGRTVLGGISKELEQIVRTELGLMARGELLGMNQRSCSFAVSKQDHLEAYQVGKKAADYLKNGVTNRMVTIERISGDSYQYRLDSCSLEEVAVAGERLMPKKFLDNQTEYNQWLKGLIGVDLIDFPTDLKRSLNHVKKPVERK